MSSRTQKLSLEIYGLLRMTIGLAQLVGLCFSYFLLEFLIRYPSTQTIQIFDQDVLALIFLAVVLRGLFHLVVGIGIARLREWVRYWIYWGWPLIAIVNIGVFYIHYHTFMSQGTIASMGEMVPWLNALVYLFLMSLDFIVIVPVILDIDNETILDDLGGRLSSSKVWSLFIIVIVFFGVLLFLGKPIKKGFHRGFYKSRGKLAETGVRKRMVQPRYKTPSTRARLQEEGKTLVVDATIQEMGIDEKSPQGNVKIIEKKTKKKVAQGLPYRGIMGACSAVSIVLGLLMQLFTVTNFSERNDGLLFAYGFLSLGFLLGGVYALYSQLIPLVVLGFLCCLISLSIMGRLIVERQCQ